MRRVVSLMRLRARVVAVGVRGELFAPPAALRREAWALYMNSREWQLRRRRVLELANGECKRCGRNLDLQVHHRTYLRRFNELDSDLVALCDGCHAFVSGKSDVDPIRWDDAGDVGDDDGQLGLLV